MAIVYVQAATAATTSVVFNGIQVGDLIIVCYQSEGGVPANPTCSDTLGTIYTRVQNAGSPVTVTAFYGFATGSGNNTVSVAGVNASFNHIMAQSFRGLTNTSYIGSANGTGTTASAATLSAAPVTTAGLAFTHWAGFHNATVFTQTGNFLFTTSFSGSDGGAGTYYISPGGQYTVTPQVNDPLADQYTYVTLNFAIPLAVTTTNLQPGWTGRSYSQTLQAEGGVGAYSWSVTSGALPAGLSLSSGGVISGTPTTPGLSTFTAQVSDGTNTASQSFTINTATFSFTTSYQISIDHTKVPSNQTNFPFLFWGNFPWIATVANGGSVTSASGYDVVFTSDPAGLNVVPFEIDTYNASGNNVAFWVLLPTLSSKQDSKIYVWVGNNTITNSMEYTPGVWTNGFQAVYHVRATDTTSLTDSTSNGYTMPLTGSPSVVTGNFGNALSLDGATQYGAIPLPILTGQFNFCITIYIKTTESRSSGTYWNNPTMIGNATSGAGSGDLGMMSSNGKLSFWSGFNNGGDVSAVNTAANFAINDGNWHHVAFCADGVTSRLYLDGYPISATLQYRTVATGGTGGQLRLGCGDNASGVPSWFHQGWYDEIQFSQKTRSTDWLVCESNNLRAGFFAVQAISTGSPVIDTSNFYPEITLNKTYSGSLSASGGLNPYVFTVTAGSLPTGVSLSGSGVFSGTPTVAGTYSFTVTCTDANSNTGTVALSIHVPTTSRYWPCTIDSTSPLATNCQYLLTMAENPQWYACYNAASGTVNPMWLPINGRLSTNGVPLWDAVTPALTFPGGVDVQFYIDSLAALGGFEGSPFEVTPCTFVLSIYVTSYQGAQSSLIEHNTGSNGFTLGLTSTGQLLWYHSRNTTAMSVISAGTVPLNTWTQVAMVYDGSTQASGVKFYINGILQTNSTSTNGVGQTFGYGASTYLRFGGGSNSINCFNGSIAYIAVYGNRQLSASELMVLDATLPLKSIVSAPAFQVPGAYNGGTNNSNMVNAKWLDSYGWTVTSDSNWDNTYWPLRVVVPTPYISDANSAHNADIIWSSANTAPPHYLIIDMQTSRTFNVVCMWRRVGFATDGFPNAIDIYVSNDGVNWGSAVYTTDAGPFPAAGAPAYYQIPVTQTARYLKLNFRQNYNGSGTANAQNNSTMLQVKVGNAPYSPWDSPSTSFANLTMGGSMSALPTNLYLTQTANTTLSNPITGTVYRVPGNVTTGTWAGTKGAAQTVTPASMTGITAGDTVLIGSGSTRELVYVQSTTATTFNAIVAFNHSAGEAVRVYRTPFKSPVVLPWGDNTGTFKGATLGPAAYDSFLRTVAVPNNGQQRVYKYTGSGGSGGSGGGTNTTGVGQVFPTGYYV